jgi:hypothetical protein
MFFIKYKPINQKAFVIIYVDYEGIFGTKEDIKETIDALGTAFTIKYMPSRVNYFVFIFGLIFKPTSFVFNLY